MKTRNVSDEKALQASILAQRIGRKVVKDYHNRHDAPKWTESMETILLKLPITAMRALTALIEDGPFERPEA